LRNRVDVIDIARGARIAGVSVGGAPLGLDLTIDGRFLYVANYSDSTISVVDAATLRELRRVSVTVDGAPPRSVAATAAGYMLVHSGGLYLGAMDLATDDVMRFGFVPLTQFTFLERSRDGIRVALVPAFASGKIHSLDAPSKVITSSGGLGSEFYYADTDASGTLTAVGAGESEPDEGTQIYGETFRLRGTLAGAGFSTALSDSLHMAFRATETEVEVFDLNHFLKVASIPLSHEVLQRPGTNRLALGPDERMIALLTAGGVELLPLPVDEDKDGLSDGLDNCDAAPNPGQENNDHEDVLVTSIGRVDATSPNADYRGDACDPDDDNDGVSDTEELGLPCATASGATDPKRADTDGDRVLDGAECALGTDPVSPISVPSSSACRTPGDEDLDGVLDAVERCFYNTNPSDIDTDDDACSDGREIASVNGDRDVNVLDLYLVARTALSPYVLEFDLDRNGSVDVMDLYFQARQHGRC
jgi:YVTN family beta-propeller protein